MESSVTAVSFLRGKLKFFKTRQATFIYVAMFYLMFLFIQKPKFVPGAEFSSNKERPALNNETYPGVTVLLTLLTIQYPFVPIVYPSINEKLLTEIEARSLLASDEGGRVCEVCQDVVIYTTTV